MLEHYDLNKVVLKQMSERIKCDFLREAGYNPGHIADGIDFSNIRGGHARSQYLRAAMQKVFTDRDFKEALFQKFGPSFGTKREKLDTMMDAWAASAWQDFSHENGNMSNADLFAKIAEPSTNPALKISGGVYDLYVPLRRLLEPICEKVLREEAPKASFIHRLMVPLARRGVRTSFDRDTPKIL